MKKPIAVSLVLLVALAVSCGDDTTQTTAGSTGAFGIVTVGGHQKMYLPLAVLNAAGNGMIAVVDVGVAGNGVLGAPALITQIDLGTPDMATTTAGTSSIVVASSTTNRNLWFIDPASDTLITTSQLNASYGVSSFSGGGGYVTGIAVDAAHNRAILSVWNGFALVDLGRRTITDNIVTAPSENFGFDAVRQRIIAPFYDCTNTSGAPGAPGAPPCDAYKSPSGHVMSAGVNVIDLSDRTTYTFQSPTATQPDSPVGSEPDAAAVDPATGAFVVPSEGGAFQSVVDLSRATFDKAARTVTAPTVVVDKLALTGVAIEPSSHLAFWEQESSSSVAIAAMSDAIAGRATQLVAQMPSLPDGGSWANIGDPHGIAVSTALRDGSPVGFLVNRPRDWVARVDLARALGLPHDPTSPVDISGTVTYLDARVQP
jgi:hypothetical protein